MVIVENIDINIDRDFKKILILILIREFWKILISMKYCVDWNLAYRTGLPGEHLESTHRPLKEHPESNQRSLRVHLESSQKVFRENSQITHRALRQRSEITQRSLREHCESIERALEIKTFQIMWATWLPYMEEPHSFESLCQPQGDRGNDQPWMCSLPPHPGGVDAGCQAARMPRELPCLSHAPKVLVLVPTSFSYVETSYHNTISLGLKSLIAERKESSSDHFCCCVRLACCQ